MSKRKVFMAICVAIVMLLLCQSSAFAATIGKAPIKTLTKEGTIMTVSWYKVSKAEGYEIQYAGNKDYKNAKTIKIKNPDKRTKKIKDLKKNKDYYVRVRAYMNADGKRIYSKWDAGCKVIAWNKNWKYADKSKYHSSSAVIYYTEAKKKKGKIVALNTGHGSAAECSSKFTLCHPNGTPKVTGGSTAAGEKYATADNGGAAGEAAVNLKIAKKTKRLLLDSGYDVLMLRQESGIKLDVIGRTIIANNNADCHVSIHYDSTDSNKGAFFCSVPNVSSYRNMYPVSKHYKQHNRLGKNIIAGMGREGVKVASSDRVPVDLMQTSFSTIPSTDIEVGDKATSYSWANINRMAKGITRGIKNYY